MHPYHRRLSSIYGSARPRSRTTFRGFRCCGAIWNFDKRCQCFSTFHGSRAPQKFFAGEVQGFAEKPIEALNQNAFVVPDFDDSLTTVRTKKVLHCRVLRGHTPRATELPGGALAPGVCGDLPGAIVPKTDDAPGDRTRDAAFSIGLGHRNRMAKGPVSARRPWGSVVFLAALETGPRPSLGPEESDWLRLFKSP